ncbi:uncharacterized mitochondrial protein AtMg00310-like [Salvia miltiorrhiza]|uniref:uncharacterized mitochondrial protein AtMg00310-like n=1 Tax=Salvia miltiorrhiza TaxID=226208 RepID=UPI0025AB955B|nr:uncharacterized mitochondrial protein AtMg00310-like [Salvia miltiorrhiza]
MACFRILVKIRADIEKACGDFWWEKSDHGKHMHWAKWDKLCQPKSRTDLGFRKLLSFNQALLAKQVWRLIEKSDSLLGRVLMHKHFRDGDIMNAKVSPNCSFTWRSICGGIELLAQGIRWKDSHHGSNSLCDDLWEVFQHARKYVVLEFFHARCDANRAAHKLAR